MEVIPKGLDGLGKVFNSFKHGVQKRVLRQGMREALKPVKNRLDQNLTEIKDTGGLAATSGLSTTANMKQLKQAGESAAMIAKVTLGRTKQREGVTGHQALQVEFGNEKIEAKAPVGRSIDGHEEEVVSDLGKNWAAGIHKEARKALRKSKV